jgi:hypothetical protein
MDINSGQHNTKTHGDMGLEKPVAHPSPKTDAEHPGYEVEDVNAKGVVVFLGGLVGFLLIFFVLCYAMGKAINFGLLKQDGNEASLDPQTSQVSNNKIDLRRGDSLATNGVMEQKEAAVLTQAFPTPRLDADDSNQSTANLHAREDLLLSHYTAIDPGQGTPGGVRIPIDIAMLLVVKRGLPANNGTSPAGTPAPLQTAAMTGDTTHIATVPLTNGFARTSYELDEMEKRDQKMAVAESQKPEQHAKLEK